MKTVVIILSVIVVILVIFQAFTMANTSRTEHQKYSVIEKDGNFEIRYYPKAIMATVLMDGNSVQKNSYSGFRTLAGYIFGGNDRHQSIPMTAPVHMQISDSANSMSFVMPSGFDMTSLPKPNDEKISLHNASEEYVAVIQYGGYSSDSDISNYSAQLKGILEKKKIKYVGDIRFLGYNPPYEILGRRNEVMIKVEYNKTIQ